MSRIRKSWAKSLALVGILGVLVFSALLAVERLGTPGATSLTADDYVQLGKNLLVANTSMVQLGNADADFQAALALNSSHPEANAYRAITRLLVLFNVPASAGGVIDSVNELLDRLGVSPTGRNLYNWTADFTKDGSGHVVLPAGAPTSAEIAQFLETYILPEIDNALANLSHIPNPFEVTLPAQIFGMHSKQQLLGYGEVAVYRSFLQALRGMILFSRSYDLDVNLVTLMTQLNAHTFQITRDLLGAYPNFLTLIDLSKLSTAQTNLKAALDSYVQGATLIRARSPEVAEQYVIHLKEADLDREQLPEHAGRRPELARWPGHHRPWSQIWRPGPGEPEPVLLDGHGHPQHAAHIHYQ